MAATAADIARVRRMVAEPTSATYTDTIVSDAILRYPVPDSFGVRPVDEDGVANSAWVATYDLHAAAADVWTEKGAAAATGYDFSADGADYKRSQLGTMALRMASYYRSRRYAGSVALKADINSPQAQDWIGNLAEILND